MCCAKVALGKLCKNAKLTIHVVQNLRSFKQELAKLSDCEVISKFLKYFV